MLAPISALLLASVAFASPIVNVRKVDALNEEATKEAHPRDDTATRAFSATEIKVCKLFLDKDGANSLDIRWPVRFCGRAFWGFQSKPASDPGCSLRWKCGSKMGYHYCRKA